MDLHPYDGKERRYRHTDVDAVEGRTVVARLLHLSEPPAADAKLQYDLSFYSGGIGVLDKLAITIAVDEGTMRTIVTALQAMSPEAACADPEWSDAFVWLIVAADNPSLPSIRDEAEMFINSHRRDFQGECGARDSIWFTPASDVNSWTAVWERDGTLNYLAYDQG